MSPSKKLHVTRLAIGFYAALAAAGVLVGLLAPTTSGQVIDFLKSIGSSVATPLVLYLTGQSAVDAVSGWKAPQPNQPK